MIFILYLTLIYALIKILKRAFLPIQIIYFEYYKILIAFGLGIELSNNSTVNWYIYIHILLQRLTMTMMDRIAIASLLVHAPQDLIASSSVATWTCTSIMFYAFLDLVVFNAAALCMIQDKRSCRSQKGLPIVMLEFAINLTSI